MLTAGITYIVAVGVATNTNFGQLTLNVDFLSSQCMSSTALFVGANAFTVSATGVTLSYGAGVCGASAKTVYNANFFFFNPSTTAYYRFGDCGTATLDTVIAVQMGCDASTVLSCADDTAGCSAGTSTTRYLYLAASRLYYIAVGAATAGGTGSGTLTVEQWSFDCVSSATAISLGNTSITHTATGLDVTYPAGTPCSTAQRRISYDAKYYSFTPAATGYYRFNTCDRTNFATFITMQTGCAPSTAFICSVGNCGSSQSITTYQLLTGGTTYYIVAGAPTPGVMGSGTLSLERLVGTCDNPAPAVEGENPFALSLEGTDASFPWPNICNTFFQSNRFFFTFTPTLTTTYNLNFCARATFQTVLSLQTGCDQSTILQCNHKYKVDGDFALGCNDFYGSSFIAANLTAGNQYLIVIGSTDYRITGTGNLLIDAPIRFVCIYVCACMCVWTCARSLLWRDANVHVHGWKSGVGLRRVPFMHAVYLASTTLPPFLKTQVETPHVDANVHAHGGTQPEANKEPHFSTHPKPDRLFRAERKLRSCRCILSGGEPLHHSSQRSRI